MILVIDDNPGFSRTLCNILGRAGYAVKSAASAEQGLGCLCEAERAGEPFELALIDYVLDGSKIDGSKMDGVELAHRARVMGSATKFLLISGQFNNGAPPPDLHLDDFEQVIGKPILATVLIEIVNRYTGRNMSIPLPKEISAAAAKAGVDVDVVPETAVLTDELTLPSPATNIGFGRSGPRPEGKAVNDVDISAEGDHTRVVANTPGAKETLQRVFPGFWQEHLDAWLFDRSVEQVRTIMTDLDFKIGD